MTRVIHTGDTHIGYRQYHSPERREDFLRAFEQVITDAIDADVDAVVHAGDLFHDSRPELSDVMDTISQLRRLATTDIPFLAIVGNHEGTRGRQWLDLLADLDLARRLDTQGSVLGDVTFYGLDYIPPARRDSLEFDFEPAQTPHVALVAHGLFEPFAHAKWDTDAFLERVPVEVDVLLLGDNHTPGRARVGGTWVTYCGSTERVSATEREERGYNIVEFGDDVRIARRTVERTRSFVFVEVELGGDEGASRVIDDTLAHDVEDAVVVVRIAGEGEEVMPADVEEAVHGAGALVVRVIDEREQPEDEPLRVRFADPDRAVEERVRELGLSPAGRMVDELVRDRDIPASNVRERTRQRIETLLVEQPEAFDPGGAVPAESEREGTADPEASEEPPAEAAGQTSIGEF